MSPLAVSDKEDGRYPLRYAILNRRFGFGLDLVKVLFRFR